jgi:hypothetical protein
VKSRDGADRAQYAYVLEIPPDGADIRGAIEGR